MSWQRTAQVFLLLLLSLFAVKWSDGRSINLPSPQCHPTVIDVMPQRIKKICEALTTIWEFSDAMENYLDEKGLLWQNR
jgi:hypothetical protein